ncbi:MAG TPA: hypothetical protein VD862_03535, partial [Candidatus Paceibacterota bacterium]|nr:hypothetical protein [Candidatus Paceibacterota bacterium]
NGRRAGTSARAGLPAGATALARRLRGGTVRVHRAASRRGAGDLTGRAAIRVVRGATGAGDRAATAVRMQAVVNRSRAAIR